MGIATPDHWHIIPAIMAAKAGKDVIGEKPLSLTVAEGRMLSDVMKQTGRIFQTASENRSIDVYIRLAELVRGGVLGKLKHIEVRLPTGNGFARVGKEARDLAKLKEPQEPPATLDYEMWLGQAPWMPYIPARLHANFRWNLAFSGGVLTDWGAHMVNLAQWGHDTEHTGPVEVEGHGDFPPRDAVYNTAPTFEVHYRYADGVTMTVSAGEGDLDPNKRHEGPVVGRTPQPGIRFEGDEGWIESHHWRGSLRASRRQMLDAVIDPEKVKIYRPSEIVARADSEKGGEHRNFLDCVKSRQPCYAPAETGHRSITVAHIGNIAMQLGRKLRWNPEAERFVGDAEADRMLSRNQRAAVDHRQHRLLDQEELVMRLPQISSVRNRPEGAVVRPAQGNALGHRGRREVIVGPTGQSFDERLARWAGRRFGTTPLPRALPWAGRTAGPSARIARGARHRSAGAAAIRGAVLALLTLLCVSTALSATEPASRPVWPFFAFDSGTKRDGLSFDQQAQLLKDLGYDGIAFSGTAHISEMLKALDARGLRMLSIYVELQRRSGQAALRSEPQAGDRATRPPRHANLVDDHRRQAFVRHVGRPGGGPAPRGGRRGPPRRPARGGLSPRRLLRPAGGRRPAARQEGRAEEPRRLLQPLPLPQARGRQEPGAAADRGLPLPALREYQRRRRRRDDQDALGPAHPDSRPRQLRHRPRAADARPPGLHRSGRAPVLRRPRHGPRHPRPVD